MQWKLADLGYYHGKLDGKKGPQTHAALARFQQNMGVQPVTGEPDDQTWSALGLSEGN
jgi:peptidoglycan hydrolase-like protein with peptidoglycan-binding domain